MPDNVITSEGRQLDMEGLRLKNEKTVAVGNMRVNARGDELDPITGAVLRTRNERMQDHYKLNTHIPKDEPVVRSRRAAAQATAEPAPVVAETKVEPAPVVAEVKTEPKVEVVADNSVDPATWVDTPPAEQILETVVEPLPEVVAPEPAKNEDGAVEVSRRETAVGIEIEYSDGSIEVIEKPKTGGVKRL